MTDLRIEYDKLTEVYSLKIPKRLDVIISRMSVCQKREMNNRMLVAMAHAAHESIFDPCLYLRTSPGLSQSLLGKLDKIIDDQEAEE